MLADIGVRPAVLGELKLGGFDLSLTGFGDLELKDLLAERTGGPRLGDGA
jgi:hypothetical protein